MSSSLIDSSPSGPSPRAAYLAIATVFFINGFGFATWVSRIPAVRDALSLSEGQLGTALFAIASGALIAFPLAGRAIGRWGARSVTIAASAAYCLSLVGPPIASGLMSLAFALLLFGLTSGAMDVAMNALAVEIEQRGSKPIMSSVHGMWSAGGFAGAIVGSFFAKHDIGVQMHLFCAAGALLLALLIARRGMPPSTIVKSEPGSHFVRPEAAMLGLGLIVFCSFLIEGAMADWSAVLLRDSFAASEATAALGYAAFSLAMMVMRFIGDRVVTTNNATAFVRTTNLVAAAAFGIALWSQVTMVLMIALVLVGLAVATLAPLVFRAAGNRSKTNAGNAIAAMATLGYGGFLVGPPVVGWFAQVSSLSIALVVVVLLGVTIAVMAGHLSEKT